jgi:DNA polymerase-1
MALIAIDTETHLIEVANLAPRMVCLTACEGSDTILFARADGFDTLHGVVKGWLESDTLVFHNAPFDLAVICREWPDLLPVAFKALEEGRVHDAMVREKLLNLTNTGNLEFRDVAGAQKPIQYNLAALTLDYVGQDITKSKEAQDAWRTNFMHLEGIPSHEWPADASDYAKSDASYTLEVFHQQGHRSDRVLARTGHDPFVTEAFQNRANFALFLMAAKGMTVDKEEVAKIEAMLEEARRPEKFPLLLEKGILIPASAPEPYANGAKNADGTPKMKAGVPEKISKTALKAHAVALAEKGTLTLKWTDPSEKFPEGQVSVDSEFIEENYHLDPVLESYREHSELDKLVSTYIPALKFDVGERTGQVSEIVHGTYDVLKRTGRTSSFAPKQPDSKKKKMYPSFNVQNQDPRIRGAIVPRPGMVLCSVDYGSLELCTLAQKQLNLFGRSRLADIINAGMCPHEFLGAQIANLSDSDFREFANSTDPYEIHAAFHGFKGDPVMGLFWKEYRTLAKPTGLGYPGGLGAPTFVQYAKATFGVTITEAQARELKAIWLNTFPEMKPYFDWITNSCLDFANGPKIEMRTDKETGRVYEDRRDVYCYESPFGLFRSGCDFCAAANGAGLQTFAADGAKLAVWNVVKASEIGDLKGLVTPLAFIHDELLVEVTDSDPQTRQAAANRVAEYMVEAMTVVCPGVRIKAEPALMHRWDKKAEPVFKDGVLQVWEPKA